MKKLKLLGLGILAVSVVIGCSPSEGGAGKEGGATGAVTGSGPAPTGKKKVIGVSIPAADHGWTAGVKYWAEQEAKNHPDVEFKIETADTPANQIQDLDAMMTQGVDGLVILATESDPVTPKAREVHDRGIFIVNVDRGFTDPSIADVFVAGDNKKFGAMSAEFVAKQMGGKGNLLVLTGIPCTVDTDRVTAAEEVFKKFPDIKILDKKAGNWNQQKAFEVTQTLLTKHPKIDAIWAQDDDMALGVERALKAAQRDKNIWILGGAGMKDIVRRVKEKDPMFPGNITYPPSMITIGMKQAVEAVKAGKKAGANGKTSVVDVPIELVTPENAEKFYFPDSVY